MLYLICDQGNANHNPEEKPFHTLWIRKYESLTILSALREGTSPCGGVKIGQLWEHLDDISLSWRHAAQPSAAQRLAADPRSTLAHVPKRRGPRCSQQHCLLGEKCK